MEELTIDITDYPEYWDYVQKNKKLILKYNSELALGAVFEITQNGKTLCFLNIYRLEEIDEKDLPIDISKIPISIRKNIMRRYFIAKCGMNNTIGEFFRGKRNSLINIKVSLPYEPDNIIDIRDIPMFSILTGINGVGKTTLLKNIILSGCNIYDENGWYRDLLIQPNVTDNLVYLKNLIVASNFNMFACSKKPKEIEVLLDDYTKIDTEIFKDYHSNEDNFDTLNDYGFGVKSKRLKQLKDFWQKFHLWDNHYYTELVNISNKIHKDIRLLSDDEVISNSSFNALLSKDDYLKFLVSSSQVYSLNNALRDIGFGYYVYVFDKYKFIQDLDFFEQDDLIDSSDEHFRCKTDALKIGFNDLSEGQRISFRLAVLSLTIHQYEHLGNTLILDEPDAHFHPTLCETMVDTLNKLSEKGVRTIISSHNPVTIARGYKYGATIYVMERNDFGKRFIRKSEPKEAIKSISNTIFEQISEDVFGFFANILECKTNNIVFVEGLTDVKHFCKAISILGDSFPNLKCDIISVDSASGFDTYYNYITSPLFKKCFPTEKNIIFMGDCDSAGLGFLNKKSFRKEENDVFYIDQKWKRIAFLTIQPPSHELKVYCPVEFLYHFKTLKAFNYNGIELLEKWPPFRDEKNLDKEERARFGKLNSYNLLEIFNEEISKTDSEKLIAYKITSKYVDGTMNHRDATGNKQETIKDKFVCYAETLSDKSLFENFRPTLEALKRIIAKLDPISH